jgi:hypothetical protein
MLKVLFDMLDVEGKSSISLPQLLAVSKSEGTRSIVRYTLFNAWIKLRQEAFFSFMFQSESADGERRITYKCLVEGLKAASREDNVRTKFIRLDQEHRAICFQSKHHIGELNRNSLHKKAYLRRLLHVGDLVWALFGGGATWFPAVIEEICEDGTYHVSYPLSAKRIKQKARNHFNRDHPLNAPKSREKLSVVPADEAKVCAYVYDQLDVHGRGQLDCQHLLNLLRTEAYSDVVKSSLAIGTLLLDDLAPLNVVSSEQTSFHQIILQLYFAKANEADGMITKIDFVEIGQLAVDLITYNVR